MCIFEVSNVRGSDIADIKFVYKLEEIEIYF
jgi:hypothetical protein